MTHLKSEPLTIIESSQRKKKLKYISNVFIIFNSNGVTSHKTPTDACSLMFTAALFIIPRKWKQPKYPTTVE